MADEQKPEGSPEAVPPSAGQPADKPAAGIPPAKPAAPAKPAPAAAGAAKPAAPKAPPPPKPPAVMVTAPWDNEFTQRVKAQFGDDLKEAASYLGQNFFVAKPESVIGLIEFLRDEEEFDYLVDITAVHWPKREDSQFDLVYVLYSFARNERIRVKTMLRDGDRVRTAVDVHPTANWLEREVYDMFGIQFIGHPDLKRILMPDEWTGFPLRKELAITAMDTRWVQENLGIESGQ